MQVTNIRTTRGRGRVRLDAKITIEKTAKEFHVFYDFPGSFWFDLSLNSGDPLLALTLLPAMVLDESLAIEAPISYRLSENLSHLQDVFSTMNPGWSEIPIQAPIKRFRPSFFRPKMKRGLFFSLGVDSFYSLKKLLEEDNPQKLSHLILVHGLDIFYQKKNHGLFTEVLDHARQVAGEYDLQVLDVVTNMRDFSDHFVNWETQYGCGTFSVGLALQRGFETLYLASGLSIFYDGFIAYGSGPLITPHWSTERTVFMQHGGGAERQDKINAINDFPAAMKHLRVCWENPGNAYNCGQCEKCLRTMIGLEISGGLKSCHSLPEEIPMVDLDRICIKNPTTVHIYQRLIDDLKRIQDQSDHTTKIIHILDQKIQDYIQNKT